MNTPLPPNPARSAAHAVLVRWSDLANPPLIPERDTPIWSAMDTRDRALAFDLVSGVIRWRGTLDLVIASQLRQPLDSIDLPVLAILWIAAYQLLIQGGVAYAAVDSAVELAKLRTPRAGGLINAVLRGITRLEPHLEKRTPHANAIPVSLTQQLAFNRPLLPDPRSDPISFLAAATSHPKPLAAMLIRAHGTQRAAEIMIHNNQRPLTIVRHRGSIPQIDGLIPHAAPNYAVATQGWSAEIAEQVATGVLSPQDPTAGKVVLTLLKHLSPTTRILDLCAGLGTKTIQLAEALPNATIIATDLHPRKLDSLLHRAEQLKLTNIQTVSLDSLTPGFDAVLVDAPCSNSGVMNRRVQARWRWPTLDRTTITTLQRSLLRQAHALTPTGIIAYATCSIDPAENSTVLDRFTTESKRTRSEEQLTLPPATEVPAEQCDGGYFALLTR